MNKIIALFIAVGVLASAAALASPASDALLAQYKSEGATKFTVEKGKQDWTKEDNGESCSSCHGPDLTKAGQHNKTHKVIEPMSPRVNPQRFTDAKKVEKWFKRNCHDVRGRECTAQEKGDILTFLLAQ